MGYRAQLTEWNAAGTTLATLLSCLLALHPSPAMAQANTVYVTDVLQLSLHEKENATGRVLRTLVSGTKLQVLERKSYYAKVRTRDGVEGWTKAAFLVTEKPARMQLNEVKEQRTRLEQKLAKTEEELTTTRETLAEIKAQADEAAVVAGQRAQELERLEEENAEFRLRLGASQITIPLDWAAIAAGLTMVLGFVAGLVWFDYRSRRRHGGFRIY